jgi:hypothetical protein
MGHFNFTSSPTQHRHSLSLTHLQPYFESKLTADSDQSPLHLLLKYRYVSVLLIKQFGSILDVENIIYHLTVRILKLCIRFENSFEKDEDAYINTEMYHFQVSDLHSVLNLI